MSNPSPTVMTLLPGQVWTAEGRFAVDGLKVHIAWSEETPEHRSVRWISIQEVHELNIHGRRHINDTRFTLRRSVEQFIEQGLTFFYDGQFYTVKPPHVHLSRAFRIRAFVLENEHRGPFLNAVVEPHE